jgi:hypothetical protein
MTLAASAWNLRRFRTNEREIAVISVYRLCARFPEAPCETVVGFPTTNTRPN